MTPACPLCGSPESRIRHAESWITIRRCSRCGFLFTEDRTGDFRQDAHGGDIASFYQWLELCRDARVPLLAARLRRLLSRLPGGGGGAGGPASVFEIGYGGGALAHAAASLGLRYTGLEPLLGQAFAAQRDLPVGATVLPLRVEEFETAERFDLVVLDNVLEHLADPAGTLRRILGLLRPGGICWVQVPNEAHLLLKHRLLSLLKKRWVTFPGHVNLFTAATLARCFREAGFGAVEVGGTSASDPVLTRLLLMRDPGPGLRLVMATLRLTRLDVLGGWAYWLDAYGRAPLASAAW